MSKNKINIILIVVFLSIIILPQILFWFVKGETSNISLTENRKLNEKPEFKFETITDYPKNFDNYYNDHLPFRTALKTLWTDLNYKLFNITVDNRVVIGNNGWLFYRGEEAIKQTQGVLRFSDKEKEEILENLRNNISKLGKLGIETHILVLPNKENIYRENLPSTIPIKNDITKAEDLIEYVENNSDIDIIYPKSELIAGKEKYQVYRKYDTHWNKIGSFIGTLSLQKAIDPNFSYNLDDIKVEELNKIDENDLSNFAGLNKRLYENVIRVKDFYPEIKYKTTKNSKYDVYTSNSSNDKVVLVVGDSYQNDMKEYFSKLYKKVVYMHRNNYSESLIKEIKPDIIIIEAVERYSSALSKKLI